jgi:WD40 repeat protein
MLILEESPARRVHTLAFSPDGLTLASVTGRSDSIRLWDLSSRQVRQSLAGHDGRVVSVAFSPDGTLIASATSDSLWLHALVPSPRVLRRVHWTRQGAHSPAQVVFAPDGQSLATTLNTHVPSVPLSYRRANALTRINLVGVSDGKARPLGTGHLHEVACLAFSPDGRRLATGSFDRFARIHDLAGGDSFPLLQGKKVHYLAFSPDGATLATGSPQGLVKVWDACTGKKRCTLRGQCKPLFALCYSPDGRTIATAGGEGTVSFWEVATARLAGGFDWGIGAVGAVAFAPDGMRAAAGGAGKVVVWDVDGWDY